MKCPFSKAWYTDMSLVSSGVDSSDNDCSDVDDVLPRQQEWFMPSSDEESVFDE